MKPDRLSFSVSGWPKRRCRTAVDVVNHRCGHDARSKLVLRFRLCAVSLGRRQFDPRV